MSKINELKQEINDKALERGIIIVGSCGTVHNMYENPNNKLMFVDLPDDEKQLEHILAGLEKFSFPKPPERLMDQPLSYDIYDLEEKYRNDKKDFTKNTAPRQKKWRKPQQISKKRKRRK